jgi:hypothetical protein
VTPEKWSEWWESFGSGEVKCLLMLYWDPIGIYGDSGFVGEYDYYADSLEPLLRRGAQTEELASVLITAAGEQIGVPRPETRAAEAATKIRECFVDSMTRLRADPDDPVTST